MEQVKNPFEKIKIYKSFKDNLNSNKIKKNAKHDQKIGIIFYTDHNLTFVSMKINLNNKINITGVTEIPIPANVIGDSLVEDINELANIVLDSLTKLEIELNNQILDDGGHEERSASYHNLILDRIVELGCLMEIIQKECPIWLRKYIERMFN